MGTGNWEPGRDDEANEPDALESPEYSSVDESRPPTLPGSGDRPRWRDVPSKPPIRRVVVPPPEPEAPEPEPEPLPPVRVQTATRSNTTDPTLGFLLALALSIGLTPFIPENTDLRYTLVWGVLAAAAVGAWLFGSTERIGRERIEDVVWGAVFGLILGVPLLFVGGSALETTVGLMFRTGINGAVQLMPLGTALAYLIFVMPCAETLFFRGLMQNGRPFWLIGSIASVWSILLFFPVLDVGRYPVIAIIIGIALVMMNMIYSYVRERNGLAAAWACQIIVNVILLFVPYAGLIA